MRVEIKISDEALVESRVKVFEPVSNGPIFSQIKRDISTTVSRDAEVLKYIFKFNILERRGSRERILLYVTLHHSLLEVSRDTDGGTRHVRSAEFNFLAVGTK